MESQDKFRIGYFADGPWSHKAFELLQEDSNIEIAFIVPRTDTTDDTLKNFAEKFEIDYLFPVNINSPEFIEKAASYQCDLFVSMSFNQIFRNQIIHIPRLDTINCHAGLLPFYRGRNILNWALINDEKSFGITVHFVDEGIDTGDIILQQAYPITDRDTYATLLEVAYVECAELLYKAIDQLRRGTNQRVDQSTIDPIGFYCGRRGIGDEEIHWNKSSREQFNFIRSICSPGPRATTTLNGEVVYINKARLIDGAPKYINTPGQLLKKTDEGYLVKTLDSFIEILEIETQANLRVGDKLGS